MVVAQLALKLVELKLVNAPKLHKCFLDLKNRCNFMGLERVNV